MSFNHGDLVTLRGAHDGGRWGAPYADWRGRITDVVERYGRHLVDVEPPIPRLVNPRDLDLDHRGVVVGRGSLLAKSYLPEHYYVRVWSSDEYAGGYPYQPEDVFDEFGAWMIGDDPPEVTRVPEYFLEVVSRPKRPKSAAKGRQFFFDARTDMPPGVFDADFHDAADIREKTLSAAVQSDLAQARSKKKGGRGRRRRRKRTRRTRRRKKRRTRSRRRKRTRRRRRR